MTIPWTMDDIKRGMNATEAAKAKYQTLKENYWKSAGNTMDEKEKEEDNAMRADDTDLRQSNLGATT